MRSMVDLALGAGSVVAEVSSGPEALSAIATRSANTVVLETGTAQSEAATIVSSLRAAHPNLVIVVCSFRNDAVSRREAALAGADAYMVKPADVAELRSINGLVRDRLN